MASEKILAQKQSYVADLKAKLDASQGGVVFNYGGITVAEDTKLRKELREAGVTYEVVKNTLLKIANLPNRDGLLSMLLSALQGNLSGLARVINAVKEQKEGEAA